MDGEITRKSVLTECLSIMRQELAICSTNFNGLEPKKGMEEAWDQCRRKVEILKDLIHAYDSEQVRAALAGWQINVMKNGPEKQMMLDDEPDHTTFVESMTDIGIRT